MELLTTQPEINQFVRKVYKFLREGHVIKITKLKRYSGMISLREYPVEVLIDPSCEIVPTLIHEILHYTYPTATEEEILKLEKRVVSKLSSRQMKNLLKEFTAALS